MRAGLIRRSIWILVINCYLGAADPLGFTIRASAQSIAAGTYNVRVAVFGAAIDEWIDTRRHQVFQSIATNQPDFMGFQEAYARNANSNGVTQQAALGQLFEGIKWRYLSWETNNAFNANDAKALADTYSRNAILLPPDADPVRGRKAIEEFRAGFIAGVGGKLQIQDLFIQGNLANLVGTYTIEADGEVVERGKYVEVWERSRRRWQLHRDIWNASPSASAEKEAEGPSLYNRLGGVYAIATGADDFIERLLVNDTLNANPAIDAARAYPGPD